MITKFTKFLQKQYALESYSNVCSNVTTYEVNIDDIVIEKTIELVDATNSVDSIAEYRQHKILLDKARVMGLVQSINNGKYIPPVLLNDDNLLVDGFHIYAAYKLTNINKIPAMYNSNEKYTGTKDLRDGENKIAFIKNIPGATALALSNWLKYNGIRFEHNESKSTSSQYFKFAIKNITFNVRVSNHTKPMENPTEDNVGVKLNMANGLIFVDIDTSVGYGMKDIRTIVETTNTTIRNAQRYMFSHKIDNEYVYNHRQAFDKVLDTDGNLIFDYNNVYNQYLKDGNSDVYGIVNSVMKNQYEKIKASALYQNYAKNRE